ncbi:Biotin carboxyl carrier protein of acetyl-CoA carboxylase [bioreactor metagenome]|uniref:Biotin carboxyl carrier protein of acetyl-CoA carboxylase n=1 Tax=bioreactor metagenome TaxID=1076179 RepID=A0A644Y710_9ZZZZ
MDIEKIRGLADIANSYGLSRLEISEGGTKILIEKASPTEAAVSKIEIKQTSPAVVDSAKTLDFNKITEVRSPIVGVFYAAPAPDADPFVSIGSKVKKGDVLCIIEAMKLMNEITAECDGEIVDICMKNGDLAEFEQVLFKIF